MTLTDHDLSKLLAALKAGEMNNRIRTSLGWVLQALIEAEATAVIGVAPHVFSRVGIDGWPALSLADQCAMAPLSWGSWVLAHRGPVLRPRDPAVTRAAGRVARASSVWWRAASGGT